MRGNIQRCTAGTRVRRRHTRRTLLRAEQRCRLAQERRCRRDNPRRRDGSMRPGLHARRQDRRNLRIHGQQVRHRHCGRGRPDGSERKHRRLQQGTSGHRLERNCHSARQAGRHLSRSQGIHRSRTRPGYHTHRRRPRHLCHNQGQGDYELRQGRPHKAQEHQHRAHRQRQGSGQRLRLHARTAQAPQG